MMLLRPDMEPWRCAYWSWAVCVCARNSGGYGRCHAIESMGNDGRFRSRAALSFGWGGKVKTIVWNRIHSQEFLSSVALLRSALTAAHGPN
ncbi:MAG: hypothetical protein OXC31_26690 [Spirochaetaceae bacterium]|nr:hypothetical protein [Spirochaetaceae bacterium]